MNSDKPHISIIVAFNVDSELKTSYGGTLDDLAIYFPAGTKFPCSKKFVENLSKLVDFKDFEVPKGMEVIVLLPAGIELLSTKQNAELLQNKQKVSDIAEHIKMATACRIKDLNIDTIEKEDNDKDHNLSNSMCVNCGISLSNTISSICTVCKKQEWCINCKTPSVDFICPMCKNYPKRKRDESSEQKNKRSKKDTPKTDLKIDNMQDNDEFSPANSFNLDVSELPSSSSDVEDNYMELELSPIDTDDETQDED